MSNYSNPIPGTCKQACSVISGNSVDIKLKECGAAEVRADVVVKAAEGCQVVRLWGQIKDCNGRPIAGALLKLVKVVCSGTCSQYEGIAHTVSDCEGFYQFDLCYCEGKECYKVLVGKAYTGPEQILDTQDGNCHACTDGGNSYYQPCQPYKGVMMPAEHCMCEQKPSCQPMQSGYGCPCQTAINIPSLCDK